MLFQGKSVAFKAREMVLINEKRVLKICSFHIYIVPLPTRKYPPKRVPKRHN